MRNLDYRLVPVNVWSYKLESLKKISKVLGPPLRSMRKQVIDLLIIDDITMLMRAIVSGTSDVRTAGNALRHIRRWAAAVGCGIVAGLPLAAGANVPEVGTDKDWEQLELYSDLRDVRVEEGPYDEDYGCDT